jgi:F-type H+-transporting ATPase subunit alpha
MSNFEKLVAQGQPIGEIIAADRFFVRVSGLYEVGINNQVLFENGDRGLVWEIGDQETTILNLSSETAAIGEVVVLEADGLTVGVGPEIVGRVLSVDGQPLDGKAAPLLPDSQPVFTVAAPIIERQASNEQLVTGITVVDTIFPVVLGQRVAVIGDARTGKSTFLTQLASVKNSRRLYVYVFINKRKADVESLLYELQQSGAMERSIVVVANIFESLAKAYIAPYVGCAIAEYLRDQGNDVVIVYDDLTNHAKIYREIALLAHASAGRDSYPGDIFYVHSSLLERAGCFSGSQKTITALPVIVTPDDDITGYLATNIMSITDGQLMFTRENFQKGSRPAVSTSISVSRIGGRSRSKKAQELVRIVLKKLTDYEQALEFSHFEAGQSANSTADLMFGERLLDIFCQSQSESYGLLQQQLMLETVLRLPMGQKLNTYVLKTTVTDLGIKEALTTSRYDEILQQVLQMKDLVGVTAPAYQTPAKPTILVNKVLIPVHPAPSTEPKK